MQTLILLTTIENQNSCTCRSTREGRGHLIFAFWNCFWKLLPCPKGKHPAHLSKLLRVLWIQTAEPMVILDSADYEAAGGGPGLHSPGRNLQMLSILMRWMAWCQRQQKCLELTSSPSETKEWTKLFGLDWDLGRDPHGGRLHHLPNVCPALSVPVNWGLGPGEKG